MPNLGIIASSISGNLFAPGKDYDSIATVTVGAGGASTITFSSIPATYRHLQIRAINMKTASPSRVRIKFNGDNTAANYNSHYLLGDGSNASAGYELSSSGGLLMGNNSSLIGTNGAEGLVIDILDYANTNKNKTVRSLSGFDANGSGNIQLSSGSWSSTAAITSIVLSNDSVTTAQYSQFALYGVK
jgi:hypothetical protein